MALVEGTNCGFCLVAPTTDPGGGDFVQDTNSYAGKFVAPADAKIITEIGWYCDNATEAANYDLGLYEHDTVNNRPKARLQVSADNAKGITAGWKSVSNLVWEVTGGETYWLAVQLDDTLTATNGNSTDTAGQKIDSKNAQTALINPWGASDGTAASLVAIYVVYKTSCFIKTRYLAGKRTTDYIQNRMKNNFPEVSIGDVYKMEKDFRVIQKEFA